MKPRKREQLTIKLPGELVDRLRAAANKSNNPYAPTVTAILEQGAEYELGRITKRKAAKK